MGQQTAGVSTGLAGVLEKVPIAGFSSLPEVVQVRDCTVSFGCFVLWCLFVRAPISARVGRSVCLCACWSVRDCDSNQLSQKTNKQVFVLVAIVLHAAAFLAWGLLFIQEQKGPKAKPKAH